MVSARFARGDDAAITVDRLVAIAVLAVLLLSMLVGARALLDRFSGQNLTSLVGVRLLAPDDVLVTFEDFERGAPGWQNGRHDASSDGVGGILGRFAGTNGEERVSRTYRSPEARQFALVSFDLHAIDDWDLEDIIIYANGVEVVRQNFSTREGGAELQRTLRADLPWLRSELAFKTGINTEIGFGSDAPDDNDQTMRVRLIISSPHDEMRLGFGSTLPSDDVYQSSWAVDNLQIVMTDRLPRN